jgi:ArsR family transcriptional regulator
MEKLEKTLKALADRNRLRIVGALVQKKLCVCELAHMLRITQPSVSKHLKKLKEAGIIEAEQKGFWTNYFVSPGKGSSVAVVKLIERLLSAEPQIKADLSAIAKSDRNKLCCR